MSDVSRLARVTDPDTAQAAAHKAEHAYNDRELALLFHYSFRGLTDHELGDVMGALQTSAGSRRCDLMKPARGYVTEPLVAEMLDDDGRPVKRRTPSGSLAKVWHITDAGITEAKRLRQRRTTPRLPPRMRNTACTPLTVHPIG